MKIYLINKETNEVLNTYENVISWDSTYVEFRNGKYRSKHYCNVEIEYYTDKIDGE